MPAARSRRRYPETTSQSDLGQELGAEAHREWHALAEHRALARGVEEDDDRPGCRRREIHDFDAVGGEALAEDIPGRIGAERADQPNRQAPAGKANGDIGSLSARLEADLGGHVATGSRRLGRDDVDVEQRITDHGDCGRHRSLERLARGEPLARRVPVAEVAVGQLPAQPCPLPAAQGREVDEPLVEVADHDPERFEVIEQRPEDVGRGLRPPTLDRELEQRGAHDRHEIPRLLDRVRHLACHSGPDGSARIGHPTGLLRDATAPAERRR